MADNDTDLNELLESCAKRARNFHVNRAVVAAIIATTVAESTQGPQGPKRADDHPFSWDDHIARLSPPMFVSRYRLTPDGFDILHSKVHDKLTAEDEGKATNSKGTCALRCARFSHL